MVTIDRTIEFPWMRFYLLYPIGVIQESSMIRERVDRLEPASLPDDNQPPGSINSANKIVKRSIPKSERSIRRIGSIILAIVICGLVFAFLYTQFFHPPSSGNPMPYIEFEKTENPMNWTITVSNIDGYFPLDEYYVIVTTETGEIGLNITVLSSMNQTVFYGGVSFGDTFELGYLDENDLFVLEKSTYASGSKISITDGGQSVVSSLII